MSEGFKFKEHLNELRKRLKVVFGSLIVIVLIVFLLPLNPSQLLNLNAVYYTTPVSVFLNLIVQQTLPPSWVLIPFHVASPFEILIAAAFILGVAIDMPVISYEFYRFVDPALKEEERKLIYPVVLSTTTLFLVGLAFGYFILAKVVFIAMAPFYTAIGISPPYYIEATDFYTIVFLSVFFSGVAFTSPVVVYLLIRFRILPPNVFSKNRVWVWVGTYVVTAVITPDGGPLLDVILFVPIILLLEVGVYLGRRSVASAEEPAVPRCSYCGSPLQPGKAFCPSCGRSSA